MAHSKGIAVFLCVSFGAAFAVEGVLRGFGLFPMQDQNLFQTIILLALVFVPALAAVIARRVEGDDAGAPPACWPVPWGKAVRIALVVWVLFAVQCAIVAVAGWATPQWGLQTVIAELGAQGVEAPPVVMAIVPVLGYTVGTVLPLVLGATLCALFAFGGEYGWRGYLLPRLEVLGPVRAQIAVGLLWALWWLPLFYFGHADMGASEDFARVLPRFIVIMVCLGVVSGAIVRRSGHLGLSAIFLGCVYAQWQGLWPYLLQLPEYPWAGAFGVVALGVWFVASFLGGLFVGKISETVAAA